MPHSQSPLTMLGYRFAHFECTATDGLSIDGEMSLETESKISEKGDPLTWEVNLTVSFKNSEDEKPSSYSGKLTIRGLFKIRESFDESNREALMRVTACSMLYGACREMLANFTARSTNGMLVLPSVSFRESQELNEPESQQIIDTDQ